MPAPVLSIVLTVLDEEESLPLVYEELVGVLEPMGKAFEIDFVDDGSKDNSFPLLRDLQKKDRRVRVVRLRKNFGKAVALAAGFDMARGAWIVTMDADLQNDPRDIPTLLAEAESGSDVVSGWRVVRKDKLVTRRIPSRVANALISRVTGVHLHDYGCALKIYRRDIAKGIALHGGMHRFIPALASGLGARVTELRVNHRPRRFGASKYGLSRTIPVLFDLLRVRFLMTRQRHEPRAAWAGRIRETLFDDGEGEGALR
jgi:glycosyltransferase involved in cell wall biosynthesis